MGPHCKDLPVRNGEVDDPKEGREPQTNGLPIQRKESTSKPGHGLPHWIIVWFYVTAVVCTWDASFIMLRPLSLPGGSLAWVWYLYKYYITLDQRYQDIGDAYVFAQSLMNYVEVVLNIVTIIMHYMNSKHTGITAFMVSVMTFWKTVLYILMMSEFCTGGEYRQGNSPVAEFFLMFIPNFVWIVVPLYAMYVLWIQLMQNQAASLGWQYDVTMTSQSVQQKDDNEPALKGFIEECQTPLAYKPVHGSSYNCIQQDMPFVKGKQLFTRDSEEHKLYQRRRHR